MAQPALSEEALLRLVKHLDLHHQRELRRWAEGLGSQMFGMLLTASEKQPLTFNEIASDTLADEPVLDYVTDLEAREALFSSIKVILATAKSSYRINQAFAAVFLVAPLDAIREKIRQLEECLRNDDLDAVRKFFDGCEATVSSSIFGYVNKGGRRSISQPSSAQSLSTVASPKRQRTTHGRSLSSPNAAVQPFTPLRPTISPQPTTPPTIPPQPSTPHRQVTPRQPTTPSLQGSPIPVRGPANISPRFPTPPPNASVSSSGRKLAAAQLCKKRDHDRCILTQYENPAAAHIFPFALSRNPQTLNHLMALLRMFWGDDAADNLSALAQDRNVTESPQNLLSLNHQMHFWFDSAKIALKPLRKLDDGSVVVQFHWLRAGTRKPESDAPEAHLHRLLAASGLSKNSWGDRLAHRASGLALETGQVFTLSANDPAHAPNFDLLQLSWDLLRVISICGAAEEEDIDDDDDVVDDDGFSIDAGEGVYEEDGWAQIYQWAVDVEMEEEESGEEQSADGVKSPL